MNTVIDITDLVKAMTDTSIDLETKAAMAAISATPWIAAIFAFPVFGPLLLGLVQTGVQKIISTIMNGIRQQAFFFTTSVRIASEAHDFINAVNVLASLPDTTSEADYAKAENDREAYFNALVILTH